MHLGCLLSFLVGYLFVSLTPVKAEVVNRNVLVLWSSTETRNKEYTYTTIHRNFESLLNYYGLKAHYVEVNFELEKEIKKSNIENYKAIISLYYDNPIKDVEKYLAFLSDVQRKNVPLIVLGEWGFVTNEYKNFNNQIDQFLKGYGIGLINNFYDNPLLFEVTKKTDVVEYERKLENEVLQVRHMINNSPENKVHLSVSIKNVQRQADHVIEGKNFFYAQRTYELFNNPINELTMWRINPFYLIENVIKPSILVPDVTTLCGKRIAFFHIDGDGFINRSDVDRKKISGEVIFDEVISKYKVPTTASVVTSEIDENYFGNKLSTEAARKMLNSPFVEPASHTFAHPLSWEINPDIDERNAYLDEKEIKKHKGPIMAYQIKGYQLDYSKEVIGSVEFIERELLPPKKKLKMIQWSGSCRPPLMAVEISEKHDLLNLNGGDSRYDSSYPSLTGLSALYRQVGPYIQVYSGAANENIYTNNWTGPFNGFKRVIENFQKTEEPRRIKPINIYYHFFSGEKESSFNALKDVYQWVLSQDINPLYASDYVKIVRSYPSVEIEKIDNNHFNIKNNRDIRTFRLRKGKTYPDYKKSKNVLGHRKINNEIYLFIGDGQETEVYLTDKEPNDPYVVSCNGKLDQLQVNPEKIDFVRGESYVPFEIEINGLGKKKMGRGKFSHVEVKR